MAYTLSNSLAEVLTIFVAMLLRWPAPLAVAQILWIHLICDGPSDIVLGFEPKEPGTIDEPPLPKNAPALTGLGLSLIGVISAVSSVSMRRPLWQMVPLKENRTLIWTVLAGIATALIAFLIPGSGLRHCMEQPPTFLFPQVLRRPGTAEAPAGQSPLATACVRGFPLQGTSIPIGETLRRVLSRSF